MASKHHSQDTVPLRHGTHHSSWIFTPRSKWPRELALQINRQKRHLTLASDSGKRIGIGKSFLDRDPRKLLDALPELKFAIDKNPNAAEVAPHRLRSPLDISLAKRELDWAPTIYLEEGIAKLAAWLQEHKNGLSI